MLGPLVVVGRRTRPLAVRAAFLAEHSPPLGARVERQFTAVRANQLWLTDITEHRTDQGKLCLCAIKDV